MALLEKIKALAKKRNLSIHQIEVRAGIGNGVISKWEKAVPNIATLQKVANVLQVDMKELL